MEKENLIEKKEHKKLFKFIKITITILLIITLFLLYSRFISTSGIDVKEYKVIANTEYDFNNINVVHISENHYCRTTNKKQLEYMVNKINETKPDLVVFTGDLIDKDTKLTENIKKELTETLQKINSKLGKYAIKGDHDYKFSEFDKIITDAGFTNLTDTYDLIYNQSNIPLMIVGFNSNLKSDNLIENKNNLVNEAIKDIKYSYKILLLHEPDYIDEIDYSTYNLILAGHSHGAQIRLPFGNSLINKNKAKKYTNEKYVLNNTTLFVSYGIGTSNISFRLFNKPSFNLYRIVK